MVKDHYGNPKRSSRARRSNVSNCQTFDQGRHRAWRPDFPSKNLGDSSENQEGTEAKCVKNEIDVYIVGYLFGSETNSDQRLLGRPMYTISENTSYATHESNCSWSDCFRMFSCITFAECIALAEMEGTIEYIP